MENSITQAIKNLFFVSGEVEECEPELVYKFCVHNLQRKDSEGSHHVTNRNALETLNKTTFKVHYLSFQQERLVYEIVLINDDRKQEVQESVITVCEEIEKEHWSGDKLLKTLLHVYSRKDAYKVLELIKNRHHGVREGVTKHRIAIMFLDGTIVTDFEVKRKQ